MANLQSIPQTYNSSSTFSLDAAFWSGVAEQKLAPKDATGAIIDLTGYNGATLSLLFPTANNPSGNLDLTMTVGTADATGIIVSATPAQVATAFNNKTPAGSYKAVIHVTDATDTVIAASGTLNLLTAP